MKKVFSITMIMMSLNIFTSCTNVELADEEYTDTFLVDPSDDGTIDDEDHREE